MIYYIYYLCDPDSHTIRYIGCTNDVSARLENHVSNPCNSALALWIEDIKERGHLGPTLRIISRRNSKADAQKVEASHISTIGLGGDLLNVRHNPRPPDTTTTAAHITGIDEMVLRGLSAEAGYEGISRNELIVRILTDTEKRLRAERLTWEQRRAELEAWDTDTLESRSDYLFSQYEERSLSPDDDRELQYINRLLNERAEAEDAKALAA